MKIPIELSRKKSAYSVYVYGALDVRLFPNKRLNVDLKNIEIWVSHGLSTCHKIINTRIAKATRKTPISSELSNRAS